jgi:hypothetical protein
MAGPREIRNVITRLPEHARLAVGTITRAAFTTGLNRILRRSSRWYREWYPWPLSAAGTSRSNSGRLAGLTTKDQNQVPNGRSDGLSAADSLPRIIRPRR